MGVVKKGIDMSNEVNEALIMRAQATLEFAKETADFYVGTTIGKVIDKAVRQAEDDIENDLENLYHVSLPNLIQTLDEIEEALKKADRDERGREMLGV